MNKTFDKKFLELGITEVPEASKASELEKNSEIDKIEKIYNLSIPFDYKNFLMEFDALNFENDAHFKPIEINPHVKSSGFQEIAFFYTLIGTDSILSIKKRYSNEISQRFIPIADMPGGNQLVLSADTGSKDYGMVYLYDHETENTYYLINKNFESFINSFEVDTSNIDDSGILSSTFDF